MILVIDANQATHRAYHISGLSHLGQQTNVIYGVLNSTLKQVKRFEPDKLVFCWDSYNNKRKKIDKNYKSNRKKDPKIYTSLYQQESQLKDIIPKLGWNQWEINGLEADDLIANVVDYSSESEQIIIVSNDSDLYQLIDNKCSLYFPTKDTVFPLMNFQITYGIEPSQWSILKAIAGCSSDNVKGLKNYGEKKVIDYLQKGINSKHYKYIMENEDEWAPNLKLVELPLESVEPPPFNPLAIDIDVFFDICQLHGFKSFLQNIDTWKESFNENTST